MQLQPARYTWKKVALPQRWWERLLRRPVRYERKLHRVYPGHPDYEEATYQELFIGCSDWQIRR